MSDLETYKRRYRRKWMSDRKWKHSLECMGLTVDEAVHIELYLKFARDVDPPRVVPRHRDNS